ncbi:unnamed protein product [Rotaria socialis]
MTYHVNGFQLMDVLVVMVLFNCVEIDQEQSESEIINVLIIDQEQSIYNTYKYAFCILFWFQRCKSVLFKNAFGYPRRRSNLK